MEGCEKKAGRGEPPLRAMDRFSSRSTTRGAEFRPDPV
jgi:hypothetical protein